jgi:hypothetical protein
MKCDYDPSIAHGTSLTPGFFGIRRWRLLARAWSHPPLSPKVPEPVFGWGLAMSH